MTERNAQLEPAAFWILTASLGAVQFNLLTAEVLFGIAAILWLVLAVSDRRRPDLPVFSAPLGAYLGLTLLSAVTSLYPAVSIVDCKQLVLFLMVPMIMRLARGDRAMTTLNVIIAVGAAGALLGVVEATMLGFDSLNNRPRGLFSTQYMTYSGLIMLVLCATVARLLFYPAQRIWPAVALPALVVALAFTLTRNAYIGAFAGIVCLLMLRKAVLLAVVPVLLLLAFFAPARLQQRALSSFDIHDESNRDRLQMLVMGAHMVRDHPLLGVGPDVVKLVYPKYRPVDAVHPINPHLHNVPVQIAAERGLPALLSWLAFIAVAGWALGRQTVAGPAKALAAAGVGAIVAMLSAGLFEYNFGDSEFLILFLALVTLPFAARLAPGRRAADTGFAEIPAAR